MRRSIKNIIDYNVRTFVPLLLLFTVGCDNALIPKESTTNKRSSMQVLDAKVEKELNSAKVPDDIKDLGRYNVANAAVLWASAKDSILNSCAKCHVAMTGPEPWVTGGPNFLPAAMRAAVIGVNEGPASMPPISAIESGFVGDYGQKDIDLIVKWLDALIAGPVISTNPSDSGEGNGEIKAPATWDWASAIKVMEKACVSCHPSYVDVSILKLNTPDIVDRIKVANKEDVAFRMPPFFGIEAGVTHELSDDVRNQLVDWLEKQATSDAPTTNPSSGSDTPDESVRSVETSGPKYMVMERQAVISVMRSVFGTNFIAVGLMNLDLIPQYELNYYTYGPNGFWASDITLGYIKGLRDAFGSQCNALVDREMADPANPANVFMQSGGRYPNIDDINRLMSRFFRAPPLNGQYHPGAKEFADYVASKADVAGGRVNVSRAVCLMVLTMPQTFMR